MKAPVIIVPQNSKSQNAIVVDLGLITVKNNFQIVGHGKNTQGFPAVVDQMVVELTNLKLSRFVLEFYFKIKFRIVHAYHFV